jgi:hypothetical protein
MNRSADTLIGGYAKLWPRELFDFKSTDGRLKASLDGPGVYILYRDDDPFYIGKAPASVFSRVRQQALPPLELLLGVCGPKEEVH